MWQELQSPISRQRGRHGSRTVFAALFFTPPDRVSMARFSQGTDDGAAGRRW